MRKWEDYLGNLYELNNGTWEEFSDSLKHFLKKLQVHLTQVQGTKNKISLLATLPPSSSCSFSLVQPLLSSLKQPRYLPDPINAHHCLPTRLKIFRFFSP